MTDVRVTADANLLASGALRMRPDAAPVRFIDTWHTRHFTLILSDHLLDEVDHTLANRYFMQRLIAADRDAFRHLLRRQAVITPITVPVVGVATHPEDDLTLATAVSGQAHFLVTGDHKLLELKTYQGVIIVSVHAFLALLPGLEGPPDTTTR